MQLPSSTEMGSLQTSEDIEEEKVRTELTAPALSIGRCKILTLHCTQIGVWQACHTCFASPLSTPLQWITHLCTHFERNTLPNWKFQSLQCTPC